MSLGVDGRGRGTYGFFLVVGGGGEDVGEEVGGGEGDGEGGGERHFEGMGREGGGRRVEGGYMWDLSGS